VATHEVRVPHSGCILDVQVCRTFGKTVAVYEGVAVWDSGMRDSVAALEGHEWVVTSIVNDTRHFMTGSVDETIRVWGGKVLRCIRVSTLSTTPSETPRCKLLSSMPSIVVCSAVSRNRAVLCKAPHYLPARMLLDLTAYSLLIGLLLLRTAGSLRLAASLAVAILCYSFQLLGAGGI
jgi:hypothetical protein